MSHITDLNFANFAFSKKKGQLQISEKGPAEALVSLNLLMVVR